MYQPETFRYRGITAITNTPPRGALTQPGGFQGCLMMDQIVTKAARQLGIDQVAIRKLNAPEGKAKYGPANARGERGYVTSCFIKEALDKGAARFNWNERVARGPQRNGSKVRGMGVGISSYSGGSVGFDGLFIIKPDGTMRVHTGIGNLGTESFSDCQRVAAEMVGMPWEKVEIVWGDTSMHLPWSCNSGGSQTIHAHDARRACRRDRRDYQAAADRRQGSRRETRGLRRGRRARLPQGRRWRDDACAGGQARHRARRHLRRPRVAQRHQCDDNALRDGSGRAGAHGRRRRTTTSATERLGLSPPRLPRSKSTSKPGNTQVTDFLAVADVGTVIHPTALGGQVLGRSILGIAHAIGHRWIYDQRYGVGLAKRFYNNSPPTILDVPVNMAWDAVGLPDPETPVGARGIGEPPVASACTSVLNAISDALGDEVFVRSPVLVDHIVTGARHQEAGAVPAHGKRVGSSRGQVRWEARDEV